MKKSDLIAYLDDYLQHDAFTTDSSKNGLQVDTRREEIHKIGYAVDTTTYLIDQAIEKQVDLLLVHHGLYRGYEQPLTGVMYERVCKLLKHDIAVYATHLPLDAHGQVGNNIGLAKAWTNIFTIKEYHLEAFGDYKGQPVGYGIRYTDPVPRAGVTHPYIEKMQLRKELYNFGDLETVSSVAFVSGGGGDTLLQAHQHGYDLFVTGEMNHRQTTLAKELGQSILLGGHYETEKIGPKLLAHHLAKQFEIETAFIDEVY